MNTVSVYQDELWYKIQEEKPKGLTRDELESLQKTEIKALNLIYNKELKIIKSMFPYKFQIDITPFLEIQNLVVPRSYPAPHITLLIEMGENYPLQMPSIKMYSSTTKLIKSPELKELESKYMGFNENPTRGFIIYEIIENIRKKLYDHLKKDYIEFKRIRHYMDEEISEDFDHFEPDAFDKIENLKKKATFTPITVDNFNEWNEKFLDEIAQKENKKKDKYKGKLSGKEIFKEISGGDMFVDEGNQDDDDAVDFDPEAFGDDDDLDELDDLLEDD